MPSPENLPACRGGAPPRRELIALGAGIVLALALIVVMRLVLFSGGDSSIDAFYHVRVAQQGPEVFAAKSFPVMSRSAWTNCFADKELGFHYLLRAVNGAGSVLGFAGFPFHWSGAFFALLAAAAFGWAGWYFKIRHLWFFIPLFVILEPGFSYRLMMLRPHVLAIALALAGAVAFSSTCSWRDCWKTVLVCLAFGWSYSNPHFILLFLWCFAAGHFIFDRRRGVIVAVSGTLALLLTLILHPQSPNNLVLWQIQCVDVVRNMLLPRGEQPLILASEAMSKGWHLLWAHKFLSAVFAANAVMALLWYRRKGPRSPEVLSLLAIAAITYGGIVLSIRAVEYAWPFNLLCFAVLFSRLNPAPERPSARTAALLALLLTGSAFYSIGDMARDREAAFKWRPVDDVAKFVRAHYPAGTVVANLNWSDFPVLYYSLPEYRFLYGLDPFFAYRADNEGYLEIQKFRTDPQYLLSKAFLESLLQSPVIYTTSPYLAEKLNRVGCPTVFYGDGGILVAVPHNTPL